MLGSFLNRGLVMVLGYTYPAYECFKIVEKNKLEIEQLRFWWTKVRVYCQIGKTNQVKFALDVAVRTLDLYKKLHEN
ncbi:hypothetical protein AAC387_Pa07g1856 [Persea americana]